MSPAKIYGPKVFLLSKIKPEYSNILHNPTHIPDPLVCRIGQLLLYLVYTFVCWIVRQYKSLHSILSVNTTGIGCASIYTYEVVYATAEIYVIPVSCFGCIVSITIHTTNTVKTSLETIFLYYMVYKVKPFCRCSTRQLL